MPANDLAKWKQGLSLWSPSPFNLPSAGLISCVARCFYPIIFYIYRSSKGGFTSCLWEKARSHLGQVSTLWQVHLDSRKTFKYPSRAYSINYFSVKINSLSTLLDIKKLFSIEPSPHCVFIPAALLSHPTVVNHLQGLKGIKAELPKAVFSTVLSTWRYKNLMVHVKPKILCKDAF